MYATPVSAMTTSPYAFNMGTVAAQPFLSPAIGDQFTIQAGPRLIGRFTTPDGYPASAYELSNGHKAVIIDTHTDIASICTFVKTGSSYERAIFKSPLYSPTGPKSGIAHLLEHLLHPLTWANTASSLGINFNAATETNSVKYYQVGNANQLPAMIKLNYQSIAKLDVTPKDLAREQEAVINEGHMRMDNDPMSKIIDKRYELMDDQPVMRQTLGTEQDVRSTTIADLKQFHDHFYNSQMITVIAGKVNDAQVLQQMENTFGKIYPQPRTDLDVGTRLALRPGEIRSATLVDPQLTFSIVDVSFPAPRKTDLKERLAMEFIGEFFSGAQSPLEDDIVYQKRLASRVGLDYAPMGHTGTFTITLETTPGMERQVLSETLGQVGKLSQWMLTPEKTEELRNKLMYKFKRELNNVEFTTHIVGDEMLSGSLPYYTQYLDLLKTITPLDIFQTAQKYLNPASYAVVFGVPVGRNNG